MITNAHPDSFNGGYAHTIKSKHIKLTIAWSDYIFEPTKSESHFVHPKIFSLHVKTKQIFLFNPISATGFGGKFGTTSGILYNPTFETYSLNQHISPITSLQRISKKSSENNPLLGKSDCDLAKMLPLLQNLSLRDDTSIGLILLNDDINL